MGVRDRGGGHSRDCALIIYEDERLFTFVGADGQNASRVGSRYGATSLDRSSRPLKFEDRDLDSLTDDGPISCTSKCHASHVSFATAPRPPDMMVSASAPEILGLSGASRRL